MKTLSMEEKLRALGKKIDELSAKAAVRGGEVKAEFAMEKAALDRKMSAARFRLAEMKAAGGQALDDVKAGLSAAYEELERAYRRAAAHFSREVAHADRDF
jgi:hypothetical protein